MSLKMKLISTRHFPLKFRRWHHLLGLPGLRLFSSELYYEYFKKTIKEIIRWKSLMSINTYFYFEEISNTNEHEDDNDT